MSAESSGTTGKPSKPSRRNFLRYAVVGTVVATAAALGGIAYYEDVYLPTQNPTTFSLGYSMSLTTNAIRAASEEQGYFKKNKLAPNLIGFTDQSLEISAFASGQFPFAWGANVPATANARAHGADVQGVYSAVKSGNAIVVRGNSQYQTVADLKGKTVGTFALPSLAFLIAAEAWNKNHPSSPLDPTKEFTDSHSALPLLNQQLLSGQLEAIETFLPYLESAKVSGGRVLTSATNDWKDLTGGTLIGSLLGARQSYAEANSEVTRQVIRTYDDGRNYVLKNPDYFDNFVKTVYKITEPDVVKAVREDAYDLLAPVEWNDFLTSNMNQFLQLLLKYGMVDAVPTGFLTNKYNP